MTLVAALIAATAALAVVVIDRLVAAQRDEARRQRDYRRSVYARFLAARRLAMLGPKLGHQSAVVAQDLALALAEIELVAPQTIINASERIIRTLADDNCPEQEREQARGAFIDLVRADIGAAALSQDG